MIIGITGEEKGRILFGKALTQSLDKPLCLVNLNHKNRNLEIAFEMENEVVYDILDYLKGDCSLYQSTLEIQEGIDLIPSSYLEDKYSILKEDMASLKTELEKEYQYILFFAEKGSEIQYVFDQWIIIDSEERGGTSSAEIFEIGKKDREQGLYLGEMKNKDRVYKEIKKFSLEKEEEISSLIDRFQRKERVKRSFFQRLFRR